MTRHKRARRIPGVVADALALGVTYEHLSAVLHKRRHSMRLLDNYALLRRDRRSGTSGKKQPTTQQSP